MNESTLVSVHGYAGDRHQIEMLEIVYRHHGCPIVICSPVDSKIEGLCSDYHYLFAGLRAYTGRLSWERQYLQMKKLLTFDADWFLLNDSDSFCFTPQLPSYLYEDENVVWGSKVNDFRKPGETWTDKNGSITWPDNYHQGHELVALQPSYFMHRKAMTKLVDAYPLMQDDPITPFIDWQMQYLPDLAGVPTKSFHHFVSCETETEMGLRLVASKVREGATFIHAVKRPEAFHVLCEAYWSTLK